MQKRLYEYLDELESQIQILSNADKSIRSILNELLSAHDKSFEIYFKGEYFDFDIPCTQEEKLKYDHQRQHLISIIMNDAYINNKWDMVTIFAEGSDPLDLQIEIIENSDSYDIADSNGDLITSLPLNIESYQVNQELEDVSKN